MLGCGSSTELVIGSQARAGAGAIDDGGAGAVASGAGGATAGGAGSAGLGGAGGPCLVEAGGASGLVVPMHRYSFDGTGGAVTDSIAAADGKLVGAGTFDGAGALQLDGDTGYVDLPNHLLRGLTDVTFMAWTSWPKGGSGFTRIFDFGSTTAGEDPVLVGDVIDWGGTSYVMASPYTGWGLGGNLGVEIGTPVIGVLQLPTVRSIKDPVLHQVTVVFRSEQSVELYLDALLLRTGAIPMGKLSDIDDVNNWLGRSQTRRDNNYSGAYTEFRIYDRALDACAIDAALTAGPDSL